MSIPMPAGYGLGANFLGGFVCPPNPVPFTKYLTSSLSSTVINQSIYLAYVLVGTGGSTVLTVGGATVATATTGTSVSGSIFVPAGATLAATVVGAAFFAYSASGVQF
jgi:hypothetical protein